MAKSKYAPALFEVIGNKQESKGPAKLAVPKWWRPAKPEESASAEATPVDSAPEASEASIEPAATSAALPAASEPAAAEYAPPSPAPIARPDNPAWGEEPETAPPLRLSGNRLVLSLSPLHASIVGGVLILALVATYGIGQKLGRSGAQTAGLTAPADELEKALQQPANPSVLRATTPPARTGLASEAAVKATPSAAKPATAAPLPGPTAVPAAAAASAETPKRGSVHVVLESFRTTDRASAEFAQNWFASKNIPTVVETRSKGGYRLVSVAGFDYTTPGGEQDCKKLCQTVASLGPACGKAMASAKLPNYKFTQPMPERTEK